MQVFLPFLLFAGHSQKFFRGRSRSSRHFLGHCVFGRGLHPFAGKYRKSSVEDAGAVMRDIAVIMAMI